MQTTFLNAAGVVLFARDDMEQGNWTQEEYTVNATFPFVAGKVIERGQRMAFRDPATNTLEFFEVRNVTNIEPEHYQQIIAEHIVVAELSDEHIDTTEITDKTAAQALTTALSGTLWASGTSTVSGTSSADIARGSVWQAVSTIMSNWNCYISPRVTVNSEGAITGRYLDIAPAKGVWRGVRLSISKNMTDASVVYDDTEVLTALFGYGGSVDVAQSGQDDKTETLTFADVVWTATSGHPAKPAGQKYLEDPVKTALYGRNGRARFGYYQNGDIKDANVLLQKTWKALQQTSSPKISITGTVSDLYRLGYADQPLRLHDTAIVEIAETGETFQKEIIKLDVDLVDPTATRPEIGDYIANIVYINRETNERTTGGGGGGGRGKTNAEDDDSETWSAIEKTNNMIALVVGTRNGDNYVKAGEIGLAINKSGTSDSYESTAYINANHVNISATQDVYTLAGDVEHDAQGRLVIKNAGGLYVKKEEGGTTAYFGVWNEGNLTGLTVATLINGDTSATINASKIYLLGETIANTITADYIASKVATVSVLQMQSFGVSGNGSISGYLTVASSVHASSMFIDDVSVGAAVYNVRITGPDSNNKYKLQKQTISGSGWTDVGSFERGDTDAAYNQGWNDCIGAATKVTRYTRETGVYGGSETHYIRSGSLYMNVGSNWYKTTQADAYILPAPK